MNENMTNRDAKNRLAASLKRMLSVRRFSEITVSDLVADCGINRKTFYYHFDNIYALLHWLFETEAINTVRSFDMLTDYRQAVEFVMDFVEHNDFILACADDDVGRSEMMRFFSADFRGIVDGVITAAERELDVPLDPEYKAFVVRFYTGAYVGILMDWVANSDKRNREKTVKYLSIMFDNAIQDMVRHRGEHAEL